MAEISALLCAGVLVILDQLTKYLISHHFVLYQSEPILRGVLNFHYIRNDGAVGGILAGHPWVFNTITVIVVAAALFLIVTRRIKSRLLLWAAALIIAGGVGNLIDRLTLGYVIDFIDVQFVDFLVFNVADCCVTVGTGMLLVYFLADTIRDWRTRKSGGGDAHEAEGNGADEAAGDDRADRVQIEQIGSDESRPRGGGAD